VRPHRGLRWACLPPACLLLPACCLLLLPACAAALLPGCCVRASSKFSLLTFVEHRVCSVDLFCFAPVNAVLSKISPRFSRAPFFLRKTAIDSREEAPHRRRKQLRAQTSESPGRRQTAVRAATNPAVPPVRAAKNPYILT
jgi:hypothetical protein